MCDIDIERLEAENTILKKRLKTLEENVEFWKTLYEKKVELMHRLCDDDQFND